MTGILAARAEVAGALLVKLSLDQLTWRAATIVVGRVESTSSRWEKSPDAPLWSRGSIVTDVRVVADDVLRGSAGGTLTVTVPGGSVGDWSMPVEDAARFAPGGRYLVFLGAGGGVVGWRQGNPAVIAGRVPALGASLARVETRIAQVVKQVERLQRRLDRIVTAARVVEGSVVFALLASSVDVGGLTNALEERGLWARALDLTDTVRAGLLAVPSLPAIGDGVFGGGGLGSLDALRLTGKKTGPRLASVLPMPPQSTSSVAPSDTHGASPGPYPPNADAWMIRGPFDLRGSTWARIGFAIWYRTGLVLDRCAVAMSTNGKDFYGYSLAGSSGGFEVCRLSLADWQMLGDLRTRSRVWVAFAFSSDARDESEGVYVDDVALTSSQGTLFADGFENGLGGWRLSGKPTWGTSTYRSYRGTHCAYCAGGGPRIASIDPGSAAAGIGSQVTIAGSGFGARRGRGHVDFFYQHGEPLIRAPIVSWSDTAISCRVPVAIVNRYPASAGSGPLTVTTGDGLTSNAQQFSVTYGWDGSWWPSGSAVYHVSAPANYEARIDAAAAVWNQSGAGFRFVKGGKAEVKEIAQDFENDILWADAGDPGIIAFARPCSYKGNIFEVDQVFNSQMLWGDGSRQTMDVQTICVHELGHWLNLRDLYGDPDGPKVMYGFGENGETKRSLSAADRDGIRWVYEHAAPDTAAPSTVASPVAARRDSTATLRLRVDDPSPSCGWALVVIRVKDADGRWVKTLPMGVAPTNEWATQTFTCKLARGTYVYHVFARDLALHQQTQVGTAELLVE